MQLEKSNESGNVATTPSNAIGLPMLPFVKSSSIVSRGQEQMREEQLKHIENPSRNNANTFWNDGLSTPMFHIEEQTGLLSGNVARKSGNPVKLSPPFGNFKRDLIHPSMLSRRSKKRKEKKRKKQGFNIDEHLAQLKRKQTGVGRNLPSARILFPERSVTVNRENIVTKPTILLPNEVESVDTSIGDRDTSWTLLEETTPAALNQHQIVKFDPADIDDFTTPFLWKPRMMYQTEIKNDKKIKEDTDVNMMTDNTALKFGIEE